MHPKGRRGPGDSGRLVAPALAIRYSICEAMATQIECKTDDKD
jgi:hypothetical protein